MIIQKRVAIVDISREEISLSQAPPAAYIRLCEDFCTRILPKALQRELDNKIGDRIHALLSIISKAFIFQLSQTHLGQDYQSLHTSVSDQLTNRDMAVFLTLSNQFSVFLTAANEDIAAVSPVVLPDFENQFARLEDLSRSEMVSAYPDVIAQFDSFFNQLDIDAMSRIQSLNSESVLNLRATWQKIYPLYRSHRALHPVLLESLLRDEHPNNPALREFNRLLDQFSLGIQVFERELVSADSPERIYQLNNPNEWRAAFQDVVGPLSRGMNRMRFEHLSSAQSDIHNLAFHLFGDEEGILRHPYFLGAVIRHIPPFILDTEMASCLTFLKALSQTQLRIVDQMCDGPLRDMGLDPSNRQHREEFVSTLETVILAIDDSQLWLKFYYDQAQDCQLRVPPSPAIQRQYNRLNSVLSRGLNVRLAPLWDSVMDPMDDDDLSPLLIIPGASLIHGISNQWAQLRLSYLCEKESRLRREIHQEGPFQSRMMFRLQMMIENGPFTSLSQLKKLQSDVLAFRDALASAFKGNMARRGIGAVSYFFIHHVFSDMFASSAANLADGVGSAVVELHLSRFTDDTDANMAMTRRSTRPHWHTIGTSDESTGRYVFKKILASGWRLWTLMSSLPTAVISIISDGIAYGETYGASSRSQVLRPEKSLYRQSTSPSRFQRIVSVGRPYAIAAIPIVGTLLFFPTLEGLLIVGGGVALSRVIRYGSSRLVAPHFDNHPSNGPLARLGRQFLESGAPIASFYAARAGFSWASCQWDPNQLVCRPLSSDRRMMPYFQSKGQLQPFCPESLHTKVDLSSDTELLLCPRTRIAETILGLPPVYDIDVLQETYRSAIRLNHPDRFDVQFRAAQEFKTTELNLAYEYLASFFSQNK